MEHLAHSLHLHPMLVHFPIALFISALGFEAASLIFKKENFHRTALSLYIAATLMSPLAVQTGLWEEARLQIHHPVLETHEDFALLTMWSALASLPILWFVHGFAAKRNPKIFRGVFLICVLFVVTTLSIAAYNGGKMVYEYDIGPDHP